MSQPWILHGQTARDALIRGVDLMTALLRPTLGPAARTVAITRLIGNDPPEVLDSGATIAQRTIQLANPFENMGGMLVRGLVQSVSERAGDGTATAAVLAQALMHGATTYVAAGGNPLALKRGVEHGLSIALDELRRQARMIDGPTEIKRLVGGLLRDPTLAEMIGEIVDSVGPEGTVLVEDGQGTGTSYEYLDGVRWDAGSASQFLLGDDRTTTNLIEPRIFVTDDVLERAQQLVPLLEACIAAGERRLTVIALEIRDSAVALLIVNRDKGILENPIAVTAPSVGAQRTRIVEDIAILTGARCLRKDAGERPEDVTIADLGRARQVWAGKNAFGFLGGRGSRDAIRARVAEARAELRDVGDDRYLREKLQQRIARLTGAAAVIRVGGPTMTARDELKMRVEAAVTSARAAAQEGVVPGGGAALLACVPALEALDVHGDEAVGVRILVRALAEPMRVIARNAGFEPSRCAQEAHRHGPTWTFDVLRGAWVDAWEAGIVDPLAVVRTTLETSVSSAATAMTGEVIVRQRDPLSALRRHR